MKKKHEPNRIYKYIRKQIECMKKKRYKYNTGQKFGHGEEKCSKKSEVNMEISEFSKI